MGISATLPAVHDGRQAGPEEIRDVIASDAEITQQVETALHADETHPAEQQFSHLSKAQKSS
jgi:hypothetical protein